MKRYLFRSNGHEQGVRQLFEGEILYSNFSEHCKNVFVDFWFRKQKIGQETNNFLINICITFLQSSAAELIIADKKCFRKRWAEFFPPQQLNIFGTSNLKNL